MKFIAFILLSVFVVSCASDKTEQAKIQDKMAHEKVTSGSELNTSVHNLINNSKTLSDKQKEELRTLVNDIRARNQKLQEDTLKLRLLMIKELISENPDRKQVNLIKKDIKRAEDERLNNMFLTIDRISTIVAKDPESDAYVNHMMAIDRPVR